MKNTLLLVSLFLTGLVTLRSAAADAGATSVYAPLASFVGGTWVARLPAQKDAPPMRIEMQFAWAQNQQGVRFDAMWFTGERAAPYTSGMYAWNAAKKAFVIFYTDSHGSLVEGTVALEADGVLAHDMTVTNRDGSVEGVRARITRIGGDVFTNEIFTRQGDTWTKLVEARYERAK